MDPASAPPPYSDAALDEALDSGRVPRAWHFWWWPGGSTEERPAPERILLRDGTTAWIRPILPEDRALHQEFFESLSDKSRYNRFLALVPSLTEDLLRRLVDNVDGVDHIAYYVFLDGQETALPTAIARIVRDPDRPDTADVAVTVSDKCQGRGIASAILKVLVERRPKGVTRIVTLVSSNNRASIAMLRRLGPAKVTHVEDGVVELRVNLVGDDTESLAQPVTPQRQTAWQKALRTRDLICPWLR